MKGVMSGSILPVIVAAAVGGATSGAHHSIASVYDSSRQATIAGTVIRIQFINPHPFVTIKVDAGGKADEWTLEMDNRSELASIGMTADTLRPGDHIVVRGSLARTQPNSLYIRRLERPLDGFLYEQIGSNPRIRRPSR
jgi:Family of unknown function (DUF6152)